MGGGDFDSHCVLLGPVFAYSLAIHSSKLTRGRDVCSRMPVPVPIQTNQSLSYLLNHFHRRKTIVFCDI